MEKCGWYLKRGVQEDSRAYLCRKIQILNRDIGQRHGGDREEADEGIVRQWSPSRLIDGSTHELSSRDDHVLEELQKCEVEAKVKTLDAFENELLSIVAEMGRT
jgi:hypothetical protein